MKVKDLNFVEIKTLPNVITLGEVGIGYKSLRLYNINDPKAPGYLLSDFLEDYYQFEFQAFRVRFYEKILNPLNSDGYLANGEKRMPIRDLAYFVKELNAGLERGKWVKSVFRNVNISTSHVNIIAEFIDTVIRNERLRMSDIIMLKYLKRMNSQVFSMLKIFSSVDVRDKQSLLNKIVTYADGFFGTNEDYSEDIDRLEIDIIRSLEGGCNKSERKTNDESKRIYHPKTALKIFKSYEQNRHGLEIWSNDIMVCELQGPEEPLRLWLEDDHYSILTLKEVKIEQCCDQCGRKFKNHHTCNTNMIVYRQIKNVKRCVINDLKRDKFNFECANEEVVVVYYDIETHTRAEVDGTKIHTPYILGFVDSKNNQFQYFTGADCMEKFIDHLFTFENTKVYINAFNGARFDQYEFVKTLNKRPDCELNKLVMNNGAILKATVRNIECFDISKHITGSLRQNLIELGCSTQKGEFDYSLGDDWEKMSLEGQQSCIKYLEGDVMGLKELSERLNKSCFENFKVNLYKYMSTSQLTYAVWVNHTYKENKFSIYLQNGEQESFFRESIFGGRTYKYKHSFTSSQRDAFLIGEISFEDVDDYLIDADVNSLYPAAMKEEFPIGEPIKVEVEEFNNFIRLNGKCPYMGIFRVEYVTNKNLIDSVLPRREKGRLIWDLHDSNGVYNSVDIDNALKLGYTIKIIEGYYWEKTSKVFCNYINFLYEFKKQAAKGTAQFTLAKLMMNGLYGKTIQRPNLDENVKIRLHEEFIKYHIKYGGVAMKSFSGGSYYLTYQDADNLEKKITKPVYLGSFILGYSRRIMLEYLQKTNPYFNSTDLEQQLKHSPYYTDTDSIQIHQRNIRAITLNKEIGGISDDLGHNCKILHGGWIAPKLYFLEYVEKKGDSVEIKYHLRGKGVPKSQLTVEIFKEMMLGNSIQIEMNRNFKRIHVNRNSNQTNVENFSILKLDSIIKEINTSPWQGRNFYDNGSVPLNHSSIQ